MFASETPLGVMSTEPSEPECWVATTSPSVRQAMRAEYEEWKASLAFIAPFLNRYDDIHAAEGLPSGWTVRRQMSAPSNSISGGYITLLLVSRRWGGWAGMQRVRLSSPHTVTSLCNYSSTLLDLDLNVGRFSFGGGDEWDRSVHDIVRGFLSEHYDPTIPEEAAEMMLMALGGRPALMPASLTSEQGGPRV